MIDTTQLELKELREIIKNILIERRTGINPDDRMLENL